jgi:hypothetical protein
MDEILPNWTFMQETPAGRLYIVITEKDGKPFQIFINGPKNGTEIRAICNLVERLATEMLPDKLPNLINHLSNITTDKSRKDKNGIECRSISEGIFIVLLKYQRMKVKEIMKTLTNAYVPATMGTLD